MGKQKVSAEVAESWRKQELRSLGHCNHPPHCLGIGVMDDRDPLGCCRCGDRLSEFAPLMLQALEALASELAEIGESENEPDSQWLTAARDVISKARGSK